MIKEILPKTSYERESFIKGFILFFLTMELFLGAISYLLFRMEVLNLKNRIFLEMKNYSYTFEGEKFDITLTTIKEGEKRFYELIEGPEGLSIIVPVPGSKEDAIKIYYPKEKFSKDVKELALKSAVFFGALSIPAFFLSLVFSLYSIAPLRRALQIIEEVMRDIIHDINTPLMTLKVNLKLLKAKYKEEEIDRAELALRQLESLKENLRPLQSEIKLQIEDVNLKDLILEELETFKKAYPHIKIETTLRDVVVKADSSALRRVISNLLDNAFKHNVKDGLVKITLHPSALIIKNTSKPIKNPEKLFERYYKESQRGLGLGLAIVKKLCSEIGCEIKIEFNGKFFTAKLTFK
ncbi:MAG: HAMP domain-containing histidine kinase [Aquificae bacterium]|nr:HAMP domain-containing histidine kinase [Aquificota bacterium]